MFRFQLTIEYNSICPGFSVPGQMLHCGKIAANSWQAFCDWLMPNVLTMPVGPPWLLILFLKKKKKKDMLGTLCAPVRCHMWKAGTTGPGYGTPGLQACCMLRERGQAGDSLRWGPLRAYWTVED